MSKTEPEAWKQGTDWQQPKGRRGGKTGKEGEGTSQGTSINDPWTWTTGWGLTVGAGWGRGEQRG